MINKMPRVSHYAFIVTTVFIVTSLRIKGNLPGKLNEDRLIGVDRNSQFSIYNHKFNFKII